MFLNSAKKFFRYLKITFTPSKGGLPKFLILYLTSKCNQRCGHCFYSESLNKRDDLNIFEYESISKQFGVIENILVGGGEPFINNDIASILEIFYINNKTRLFSIPTNATLLNKMTDSISMLRKNCVNARINLYISFDGMEETHNKIRDFNDAFTRSMNNLDILLNKYSNDRMISFSITTTLMDKNVADILSLNNYVKNRFGHRVSFNIGLLRGEPKDPTIGLPPFKKITQVFMEILNKSSFDSLISRIRILCMFSLKMLILKTKKQVINCKAGRIMGVIYANGDVSSCELLPSIGNLRRDGTFSKVWFAKDAIKQKERIKNNECACTHGCFLTPSFTYSMYTPLYIIYLLIMYIKIKRWALK